MSSSIWRKHLPGALQFLVRVDAKRRRVDDRDVDSHSRLEGAQLLQPFAQLQLGGWEGDESGERGATVGIEPDVMKQRPVAPRRAGARKVQRSQTTRGYFSADRLDDVRIV